MSSMEMQNAPIVARGLPRLEYDLRTRKLKIALFWGMVALDSMIIPVVLYFTLWKGSGLDQSTVYNIISATLAGTAIFEYVQRGWSLVKKSSDCRPMGAKRIFLDSFQWQLTISLITVIVLVVVGSLSPAPQVRLLAMVAPAFIFTFGLQLLVIDILRICKIRAPIRLSSMPRGSVLRPAIYSIMEDVVAVDGGGGTAYRERLNKRYEASFYFRRMMNDMSFFWSIPAMIVGASTTVFVLMLKRNLAYLLGWCIPFTWGCIWGVITIKYVVDDLKIETEKWEPDQFWQ